MTLTLLAPLIGLVAIGSAALLWAILFDRAP